MSTRRQKISGQNSETNNIWIDVVFLHAHGVGSVHTACLALLDHSCQTDDAKLILRIANGADRNYPRWCQRMEMHSRHVHISVQLLDSLLHFIIASVSALMVSAVQIQMMDRLNEGLSLHTMYICTFCAWLNPVKVCGSVLVWNTYTTCIFLRRLHGSTSDGLLMVAQRKGALNIHWHASCFGTLHVYLRSASVCAWIILSNIWRWTRLWSWVVHHRWSTMDGARRQFPTNFKMSFPTNFKMGHVERLLNWNISKFSLSSDFYPE